MKRSISAKFNELRASGSKALIPYLTCGYPSIRRFVDFAQVVEDSGANLLEIGLPHSDPMADGPTIRYTSHQALSHGLNLERAFESIRRVADKTSIPLIAMCYVNTILKRGIDRFAKDCEDSGISGVIVPDLIYEERQSILRSLKRKHIDLVFLAAPTTPQNRLRQIASASSGFLYLVSVTGITGARKILPTETERFIRKARTLAPIPMCVGFGVSSGELANRMGSISDGVIVGSAILDRIRKARNNGDSVRSVASFMKQLRKGLDT